MLVLQSRSRRPNDPGLRYPRLAQVLQVRLVSKLAHVRWVPRRSLENGLRVNVMAVAGAGVGLLLAAAAHAKHPAQVVVSLAAGCAFLAVRSSGQEDVPADWFTVRLLLAGDLVVFGVSSAHDLGDAAGVVLVLSGALLAATSARVYLRERAKRKTDR